MVLALRRGLLADDLVAVPGFVVVPLSLLPKHMSNVVGIHLFELVSVNLLGEFRLPEPHGVLHRDAHPFQEKT